MYSKIRTIPCPEAPDTDLLYYVFIEINIDDIRELRRVTTLELNGTVDADMLAAFTQDKICMVDSCYTSGFDVDMLQPHLVTLE